MFLKPLDRKLLRETGRLKGQIATIALVLAAGITSFVALRGACTSLDWSREAYYDHYRFADVFARLERAPESVARRIEALPGVAAVQTRVAKDVTIPIEGMPRPAYGRILSLPASGEPATNALCVRKGRLPDRERQDEIVVSEPFAESHGLLPGHHLPVVMNGKLRKLRVVGVVLSPEYVYALRPGAFVDDPPRYGVLWMDRTALASAFQLDGAFNDVSLRLQPEARENDVRAGVDRILEPYGGVGAVDRAHQTSNKIVTDELAQLNAIAGMVPIVFLAVAAFLINMVLGRLVTLQRPEIATLKAVGYTNREIARHFLGLVVVVLVPGAIAGVLGGAWLGRIVLELYASIFRFPELSFRMSGELVSSALLVSAAAASGGALLAVRGSVRLPPAEAMRPPAPSRYRRGLLERLGLARVVGPSGMMILREIQRHPLRTALSVIGMAGAIALIVLGHFGVDSLDRHIETSMRREQQHNLAVAFIGPVDARAIGEIARMPGITRAEGTRVAPVRVRFDQRWRDSMVLGLPAGAELRRVFDQNRGFLSPATEGVLVSRVLGEALGFSLGDRVDLELREGERRTVRPVVVGFVDDSAGLQIYARRELLDALERDDGAVSAALLAVTGRDVPKVEELLRRSPKVIDVADLDDDLQRLRDMNGAAMDIWTLVSIMLSACVIFGVVYNNARIALAMRSRELASLRVLGLSRGEISTILIGGLAVEVVLALPLGLALGRAWSEAFMSAIDPEVFRWKVYVEPATYTLAGFVALVAASASALWVRRSLDRLDLIGVLKTRE